MKCFVTFIAHYHILRNIVGLIGWNWRKVRKFQKKLVSCFGSFNITLLSSKSITAVLPFQQDRNGFRHKRCTMRWQSHPIPILCTKNIVTSRIFMWKIQYSKVPTPLSAQTRTRIIMIKYHIHTLIYSSVAWSLHTPSSCFHSPDVVPDSSLALLVFSTPVSFSCL